MLNLRSQGTAADVPEGRGGETQAAVSVTISPSVGIPKPAGPHRGFVDMLSAKRKCLVLAFLLTLIALGVAGCRGFFPNPVLTGLTVSTLDSTNLTTTGSTAQLVATGNYDDGSHKNLTGAVKWTTTAPSTLITLSTTSPGLVTAVSAPNPGVQATVQAATISSDGSTVSGTVTLTVGQSSTLTVSSNPASPISIATNTSVTFTATLNGTDVTSSTTFTSSDPTVIRISGNTGTIAKTGTVTITGTDTANNATGTLSVTVQ